MNIIVFGKGFLGSRIAEYLGAEMNDAHISSIEDIGNSLPVRPDVIINATGKTGRPNVDWCEDHKEETWFANVDVVRMFAEYTKREGIMLVHFSSGCIYEGDNGGKGFSEDDAPNFEGSYYSHTKAEAERLLKDYNNVIIVRPRMPVSSIPSERNLINKLLGYKKIILVPNSITIIEDLLPTLKGLIEGKHVGTFNAVNPEPVTHKDILDLYEKYSGIALHKEYIPASALNVRAPRSNTILSAKKLELLGLGMAHTKESLERIVKHYAELEKESPEK